MVLDCIVTVGMRRDRCESCGAGHYVRERGQRQLNISMGILLHPSVVCHRLQYACDAAYVVESEREGEAGRECAPNEFLQCRLEPSAGEAPAEGEGTKCYDPMPLLPHGILYDMGMSDGSSGEAEYVGHSELWFVTLRGFSITVSRLRQLSRLFEATLSEVQKEESREAVHHFLRWS